MPWLAEKPESKQTAPADSPKENVKAQYGEIEVYFGSPSSSRGTEVRFKNDREKQQLFVKGAGGGAFTTRTATWLLGTKIPTGSDNYSKCFKYGYPKWFYNHIF
jgi:hypothetical protein